MKISEKDLKLLWGRSGNLCALCRTELSSDKKTASKEYPLGEQAHIVAEESSGPRGNSQLTKQERNIYSNLILLCPTDHKRIDKDPINYPIEKLHLIKCQHEFWVKEKLSNIRESTNEVSSLIYADIIDATVYALDLDNWDIWSSHFLSSRPRLTVEREQSIVDLQLKVAKTLWPGKYKELEKVISIVSNKFRNAIDTYMLHVEIGRDGDYEVYRFYRHPEHSDQKVHEFDTWMQNVADSFTEAVKALNWFADVVRRDINPLFFATKGKFMVCEGPFEDLRYHYSIPEYSQEERNAAVL